MTVVLAIPRRHGREASGNPSHLRASGNLRTRQTHTIMNGLRYEARVSAWLAARANFHPQIEFQRAEGGSRFRPDGLLFSPDWARCCVVEIKNQHCTEGVEQLLQYQSWLCEWFRKPVQALMITQVYRPELAAPLVPELECITRCSEAVLGVLTLAARSLPRLRRGEAGGLDVDQCAADVVVRSARGSGHSAGRVLRCADVAAHPRAR